MTRTWWASAVAVAGACGCASPPEPQVDRAEAVASIVAHVILPTIDELAAKGDALRLAALALEGDPDRASLEAAQAAWREARSPWRRCDAFRYGPVVDLGLAGAIDWWPAKPASIEAVIDGGEPLDEASIEALGSSAKGFMALEYLLFGGAEGDDAVLAALADETAGPRRRALARLLAANLHGKLVALASAWAPGQGDYATQLAQPGESSQIYPTTKKAVDELVNQLVFQTENVADAKIGKPFGKTTGGPPLPDAEESPRSDNSLADIEQTLRGLENVYEGRSATGDGLGVADMVRARSEGADDATRSAFAGAFAATGAIPPPLRLAFTEHPQEVEATWQAVKALKRVLGAEVVSVLGVTVSFSDNDGD